MSFDVIQRSGASPTCWPTALVIVTMGSLSPASRRYQSRCGGDPATSPRVDSFRVYRRGKRIDWYNVVNDAWRPFDKIHSEGGR